MHPSRNLKVQKSNKHRRCYSLKAVVSAEVTANAIMAGLQFGDFGKIGHLRYVLVIKNALTFSATKYKNLQIPLLLPLLKSNGL